MRCIGCGGEGMEQAEPGMAPLDRGFVICAQCTRGAVAFFAKTAREVREWFRTEPEPPTAPRAS